MSNNYWDDEDEDDVTSEAQLSEGDLIKKLRKAERAKEKRIKELTEQLESLSKSQRERTVKEILDKKGVNQKAARFILNEVTDSSEEAINAWLEENGDLFGFNTESQPKPNEANLAALRQQDIITEGAMTPDKMEDASLKIDSFSSQEELVNFLRSQS